MNYVEAITSVNADKNLYWDSTGYWLFGDSEWKDISITAKMIFRRNEIGLFPRFVNENMYMAFLISHVQDIQSGTALEAYASVSVRMFDEVISLGEVRNLPPLVEEQEYTLKAVISNTNYKLFLNNEKLFDIDYGALSKGKTALYAASANECVSVSVESVLAGGWESNIVAVTGGIVSVHEEENEDKYLYLYNPDTSNHLQIKQHIAVKPDQEYTLSYDYQGLIKVKVLQMTGSSTRETTYSSDHADEWTRVDWKFKTLPDCSNVLIIFFVDTDTPSKINNIQLEEGVIMTSYIKSTEYGKPAVREDSEITFPSKGNIKAEEGSISLWVNPSMSLNANVNLRPVFVEFGEGDHALRLFYDQDRVRFQYGGDSVASSQQELTQDTWHHLVARWSNTEISLVVNNSIVRKSGSYIAPNDSGYIKIGHSNEEGYDVLFGGVDDVIIYSSSISDQEVQSIYEATEPIETTNQMVLRATFNHAIGNFNASIIELPGTPPYRSPIVVEKENGSPLEKVSFFDIESGNYEVFYTEKVVYDGKSFVQVSYENLNPFSIKVQDEDQVTYGEPYSIDGDKIYLTLTDQEKDLLCNKTLLVTYQIKDTFIVDHNIETPDAFRIELAQNEGQPVVVTYEGNRLVEEKLADMIELNPLKSHEHEGFLYITNEVFDVSSLQVKTVLDYMPADGLTESLVIIDAIDQNGNYVSNSNIRVSAKYGKVIPSFDPDAISLREKFGRHIFIYRAPHLIQSEIRSIRLTDYIQVKDKKTGIGTQVPISLSIQESYETDMYRIGKEEEEAEMMASYILQYIFDWWNVQTNKVPADLLAILDVNGDGKIGMDEAVWLHENLGNEELLNKYTELKSWAVLHQADQ